MKQEKTLYVKDRAEWRAWLEANHDSETSVWLIYFKRHTGKPRIPYDDGVEEAVCFGWIDTTVKRIDESRYMQRFTQRKSGSGWSLLNRRRAERMIKAGLMTGAGMARIEEARKNGRWELALKEDEQPEMPDGLAEALGGNPAAKRNFEAFAPSCRKAYIRYVSSAKRDVTREKRIREVVRLSADNIKPRMQ